MIPAIILLIRFAVALRRLSRKHRRSTKKFTAKKKDSENNLPESNGRSDTTRTCDPRIPNAVRYQLRYTPNFILPIAFFLIGRCIISKISPIVKYQSKYKLSDLSTVGLLTTGAPWCIIKLLKNSEVH